MKFLLGDESYRSSVVSSLKAIRENVRTTRDVVLEQTWELINELINELSMYVHDNLQHGINRSQRYEFLEVIIKSCQQILGLLYGNMPHDAAWGFLRLGRNLERADMTTRNLDAVIAAILELERDDNAVNSQQIIRGTVLRPLNADQSYRRNTRSAVKGEAVLHYLLEDPAPPRSITHRLNALADSCAKLPRRKPVMARLSDIQENVFKELNYKALDSSFRDHLNHLQINVASVHRAIGETWFPVV